MRAPEFWNERGGIPRLASALLSPVGRIYGATVAWKRDHTVSYRSRAKVVCVGNLTAGGTGKTPIAIAIAGLLTQRGLKTVFLSRGYGGKERGPIFVNLGKDDAHKLGDEPLLLAGTAATIVSRDRKAGAMLAEEAHTDVIIMDDGHQNFALAKDLSFLVVDAETGFGNAHIIPAGPLREPVGQGLARADAVILNGDGNPDLGDFRGPVLRSHLNSYPNENMRGARVVAFAGTGRPEKFFATLAGLGAQILEAIPFADHHEYAASELARLKAKARAANAVLITTEKDFVRLCSSDREGIQPFPVKARFEDQPAMERLLDSIATPAIAPA